MVDQALKRAEDEFLGELLSTAWTESSLPGGMTPLRRAHIVGPPLFEVAVASATHAPTKTDMRDAHLARWKRQPGTLLLIALYPGKDGVQAAVAGLRDAPPCTMGIDLRVVAETIEEAFASANPHAAELAVERLFAATDDGIPGLRNEGLFALHELQTHVPEDKARWSGAVDRSAAIASRSGTDLVAALGWELTKVSDRGFLVAGPGRPQGALAVVLDPSESFGAGARYSETGAAQGTFPELASPVEKALAFADSQRLRWVIAVKNRTIRLYSANADVGVGRKGTTATFLELDLVRLAVENLGYLTLLLSPEGLEKDGFVDRLLKSSADHAADLGSRLRERVYDKVVPLLAMEVARQTGATTEAELQRAYHLTLTIVFRILFVAYAEDRGLLPYRSNAAYRDHSLKLAAQRLATRSGDDTPFDEKSTRRWSNLAAIWSAVAMGDHEWGIPPYGGALFDLTSERGQAIAAMALPDTVVGKALEAMLVDEGKDRVRGAVDFTTLSVREFGTIYEGLLESSLSIAETNLVVGKDDAYIPASEGDDPKVKAGETYLHSAFGTRKATGSYFTKPFAVEHLLTTALTPTLDEHLARVKALADAGNDVEAGRALFDFRVADIAMGSGHFLVAAIDRIATRMSAFLADTPIASVAKELAALRTSAESILAEYGQPAPEPEALDHMSLLRRQIARRCIYGVDINEIAVDLARLGLWIHTFVPGLPMSSLDHGLVQGNSLTGILSIDEALEILEGRMTGGATSTILRGNIEEMLEDAARALRDVAAIAEANTDQTRRAQELRTEALATAEPAKAILDAAIAKRLDPKAHATLGFAGTDAVVAAGRSAAVQSTIADLDPVHFPAAFPEVFLRSKPGFDVVLGNPPWDKIKVEEHQWWGQHIPQLRGMRQAQKNHAIREFRTVRPDLVALLEVAKTRAKWWSNVYKLAPGDVGSGDSDLAKCFAWRDWLATRGGGRVGLVLPRMILSGAGMDEWRREVIADGGFSDVALLTNRAEWVFDGPDSRLTVALAALHRSPAEAVTFTGPFDRKSAYEAAWKTPTRVTNTEFLSWSTNAAFPALPSAESIGLYRKLQENPSFVQAFGATLRPVRELDTSKEKRFYDFEREAGPDDIQVWTGATFNLWNPDFGEPYAVASRHEIVDFLQTKRKNQVKFVSSAFYGEDASDTAKLPLWRPRIAFRDVARATDTRTMICCLVPPGVALVETAPYFADLRGDVRTTAHALGVLSSLPFDWVARTAVENHVKYDLLNALPTPPPTDGKVADAIIDRAARLASVDARYADWAAVLGVGVGTLNDPADRAEAIDELDALVALAYGLNEAEVTLLFESFHTTSDQPKRLDAVLAHYRRWSTA